MQAHSFTAALGKNYLFATIPDDELESIAARLSLSVFRLGDVVIRQGDEGDALFVIYAGKARVVDENATGGPISVAVLGPGDSFGERALLRKEPRTHTVRAAGGLTVLRFSASDFAWLLNRKPELAGLLEAQIQKHAELNFLKTLGTLSHLTTAQSQDLLQRLGKVRLRNGEVLFREGDEGQSCYLVREGRLRILKRTGSEDRPVGTVRPGDLVGEISLLYNQPRSATAIADGDVTLLCLSRELFDEFIDAPAAHDVLLQQATNRLLRNEVRLAENGAATGSAIPSLKVERVQSYPLVSTTEPLLNGIACLMMIHHRTGQRDSFVPDFDRKIQEGTPDTLLSISRKAEELGYLTRLLRIDAASLPAVPVPAIVELAPAELAVVYKVSLRSVILADPSRGLRTLPRRDFAQSWNGQILTLASVPNFALAGTTSGTFLRQFVPFLRPFAPMAAAFVAVSLLAQIFGLAQPLFSRVIIDKVLVTGDTSMLHLLLLGMLVVTFFQMGASTVREYLVAHIMRRISGSMQLRFFHHVLWLTQKNAARWQTGDFLLRFQENEKLLQLVAQSGFKIIVDSSMAILFVCLLFSMNATLAAAALPFIAAMAIMLAALSPLMRRTERQLFAARQETESYVIETVTGIQTVKSLAVEEHMFDRGRDLIGVLKRREFDLAKLSFTGGLISNILTQGATVVILGLGAKLSLTGNLTTGQLVAFLGIFGSTMTPLRNLIAIWDEIQEIRISFERTTDVLGAEIETQPKDAVIPVISGRVEFRNVGFRYAEGQDNVLSGVNLEILPGQKIALVGRSGSGKTTLGSLLLNLYQPTEGSILVDDIELNRIHKTALRQQIGVVEQSPHLFTGTIRENIAKGDPNSSLDRVIAAATLAGAHSFIEQLPLGYDSQIGERGLSLSGGQRQRLVIARAILNSPRMLILDEATSALDTESESLIQRNLDAIMKGRTTFVIAHRLSTVRNADLIVVIDKGRVVEKGTHNELMERRGLYSYLNAQAA